MSVIYIPEDKIGEFDYLFKIVVIGFIYKVYLIIKTKMNINKINNNNFIKTLILFFEGETGVGKTNILNRFTKDRFSDEIAPTVGVDFST